MLLVVFILSCLSKMFIIYLIFSLLIAFVGAPGEFSVLHHPDSIKFTGKAALESIYVGDVLMAALGNAVSGKSRWPGLQITDPFALANTTLIVVHVDNVLQVPTQSPSLVYELLDSNAENALNEFVKQLKPDSVNNFNFIGNNFKSGQNYFGNQMVPIADYIRYLDPFTYTSHERFLQQIGYMEAVTKNITPLMQPSHVILFHVSLRRLAKGTTSNVQQESKQIISQAVENLLDSARDASHSLLFVQVTERRTFINDHVSKHGLNTHNPFEPFHDADYPIILNIVVWLTLTLALSILVTSYVIASIDPGRESPLYRYSIAHQRGLTHAKKRH